MLAKNLISHYFQRRRIKFIEMPKVCGFLYDVLFPYLVTLQFGGSFQWEKDKNKFTVGCPDNYKVVVEIRKVEE